MKEYILDKEMEGLNTGTKWKVLNQDSCIEIGNIPVSGYTDLEWVDVESGLLHPSKITIPTNVFEEHFKEVIN